MRRVFGQCYEIRERLKALGCTWNGDDKCWFAPDEAHGEAQSLADVENRREWLEYLGTLPWCDGEFTSTVWLAALRAASLKIQYAEAWREIASRVRAEKRVNDKWLDRNVGRAFSAASAEAGETWKAPDSVTPKAARPSFRNETLSRVAGDLKSSIDRDWLACRSPLDPVDIDPGEFLAALYEPGDRVVVFDEFRSQGQWLWSEEEGFVSSKIAPASLYEKKATPFEQPGKEFGARGPEGVWYLCNPVSGKWEWMEEVAGDDDPHWSRRFEPCVTSWRYMVLESDKARARDWVAMAVQLPLRIAAIYTSGGKSVHVLVRVDAKSKMQWDEWRDEIKPIVVTLGADPGAMSAVRLTRLPSCLRGDAMQKLLYLNPAPDMTPIISRPRKELASG